MCPKSRSGSSDTRTGDRCGLEIYAFTKTRINIKKDDLSVCFPGRKMWKRIYPASYILFHFIYIFSSIVKLCMMVCV